MGTHMGIPTEILWEWEWKFPSNGNPDNDPSNLIISKFRHYSTPWLIRTEVFRFKKYLFRLLNLFGLVK